MSAALSEPAAASATAAIPNSNPFFPASLANLGPPSCDLGLRRRQWFSHPGGIFQRSGPSATMEARSAAPRLAEPARQRYLERLDAERRANGRAPPYRDRIARAGAPGLRPPGAVA